MNKLKRAVVKEELFALTGDLEKSIILNQFIYWSERIKDFDKFIEEEKERAAAEDEEVTINGQNGWIYKDMEELKDEVMFNSSISTMSRKLNDLIKEGWMERRRNPKYKWDKRYQYRVNLNKVSKDLFELGYILQDYKVNLVQLLKPSNLHSESSNLHSAKSNLHSDRAISETTTETTLDITIIPSPKLSTKEKEKERKNEYIDKNGLTEILINSNAYDVEEEFMTAIPKAIRNLYYTDKPLRLNDILTAPQDIREDLKLLRWKHIDLAIRSFKKESEQQELRNPIAYLSICIYNSIFDSEIKLNSELRYNGHI